MPCSSCGLSKRHLFDSAARDGGYDVVATGHNLDDEAARLLGNVLHWQVDHLARQRPVMQPRHAKFVRKVVENFQTGKEKNTGWRRILEQTTGALLRQSDQSA